MTGLFLLAAMTSTDALCVVLNTPLAASAEKYAEAVSIVRREAARGKRLHQFVIAVTGEEKELAKGYLESSRPVIKVMAENRDNPLAWYLLSMETNDMRLLERAAKGGNVQALNALGAIRLTQSSRADSPEKALSLGKEAYGLFKRSALKRDPNGFFNVGTCCMRAIGCKANAALAFECFKTAARFGHPEAMASLSYCYSRGDGVEKDSSKALEWSMRAKAARGDKAAAKWLEESK